MAEVAGDVRGARVGSLELTPLELLAVIGGQGSGVSPLAAGLGLPEGDSALYGYGVQSLAARGLVAVDPTGLRLDPRLQLLAQVLVAPIGCVFLGVSGDERATAARIVVGEGAVVLLFPERIGLLSFLPIAADADLVALVVDVAGRVFDGVSGGRFMAALEWSDGTVSDQVMVLEEGAQGWRVIDGSGVDSAGLEAADGDLAACVARFLAPAASWTTSES